MTLISLQRDFLPTDTVVTPPEILNHLPTLSDFAMIGAYIVAAGIGFLIVSFSGLLYDLPFKKSMVASVLILGVGAAVFANGHSSYEKAHDEFYEAKQAYNKQVEEQSERNRENLFANIEAVYDIESIEINPDTVAMLTHADVGRVADVEVPEFPRFDSVDAVVFQDDRTFDVSLKQNPDTYEPTLFVDSSDTPIRRK